MSHRIHISHDRCHRPLAAVAMLALILIGSAQGQTTQFTYQGKLNDNGNPAGGQYDFQFKLFDTATVGTGTQQGNTIDVPNVSVTAGIFSVQLDFGAAVFPGPQRFLEISVRPAGGGAFTMLAPRQAVTSTPYALRSLTAGAADTAMNATQLAGLTASGFIQNTTTPQAATDFNIEGTGTANIFNAATQYSLGGNRILSNAGTNNLFAGVNAGANNTTGTANVFFGKNSGQTNTTGSSNSFVGYNAGAGNTTGFNNSFFGDAAGFVNATAIDNSFFGFLAGFNNTANKNSFFGSRAGADNTTGLLNSFFGNAAGVHNTTGDSNAFFGHAAGLSNSTGAANSFFGTQAGQGTTVGVANSFFGRDAGPNNTTGSFNTFLGVGTGQANTVGSNNTLIGIGANVGANDLTFATAIGAGAVVNTSDTLVLGRNTDTVQIPGALSSTGTLSANIVNATTQFNIGGNRVLSVHGDSNIYVGFAAGESNTTGVANSFFGILAGRQNLGGNLNAFFGRSAGEHNTQGGFNAFFGSDAGYQNTIGFYNSFFGAAAGFANTTGEENSFFGRSSGLSNQTGNSNSFFGWEAGRQSRIGNDNSFFGKLAGASNDSGSANTMLGVFAGRLSVTGNSNSLVGAFAGFDNTTGSNLTIVGANANVGAGNLINATAIGSRAFVAQSNSLVLGGINGVNGATADTNVGIGTSAPDARLHIAQSGGNTRLGNPLCGTGLAGIGFIGSWNCSSYAMLGGDGHTYINRSLGGAIIFREANGSNQVEIRPGGFVGIAALDTAGSQSLCRNGVAAIATCSSSLRYKTDIEPFSRGLELIKQLRPIRFTWKQDGKRDVGFAAEEVAAIEPLMVTHNDKG
ncbi:MAG TPA: tail fiber domain-containing protein, partial [Blastocatellia bacterium]|nr:tail fiber domain-containing protein [Blastocatellia bacterium]